MNISRTTTETTAALPAWQSRALWLVLAVTTIRVVSAMYVGLTDTEAYYASWARVIDWSYYDHPPLIAWMVAITSPLVHGTLGIRLGSVISGVVFTLLFHELATRLFSARAAFFAVATLVSIPAFCLMGFVLNPEAILAPLWTLALLL